MTAECAKGILKGKKNTVMKKIEDSSRPIIIVAGLLLICGFAKSAVACVPTCPPCRDWSTYYQECRYRCDDCYQRCEGDSCVPKCDPNDCERIELCSCVSRCDPDRCQECDGEGNCPVCSGDPDKFCCNGECCSHNNCEYCDSESGTCKSECDPDLCQVCDGLGNCPVCSGEGEHCCTDSGSYCCESYETCCQGNCCGPDETCCNGACCDIGYCCNNELCCGSGEHCCTDSGSYCCPDNKICCGGNCCDGLTEKCCDGVCYPKCENSYETGECDAIHSEPFECPECAIYLGCAISTTRVFSDNTVYNGCSGGCPGECDDRSTPCYIEYACDAWLWLLLSCYDAGSGKRCNVDPSGGCYECYQDIDIIGYSYADYRACE